MSTQVRWGVPPVDAPWVPGWVPRAPVEAPGSAGGALMGALLGGNVGALGAPWGAEVPFGVLRCDLVARFPEMLFMVVVYTFGNLYSAFDAESSDEDDRTQDKVPNHRPGLLFANATYATRKGPCDAHLYSATADHCRKVVSRAIK